jgi:hypothetical protein
MTFALLGVVGECGLPDHHVFIILWAYSSKSNYTVHYAGIILNHVQVSVLGCRLCLMNTMV